MYVFGTFYTYSMFCSDGLTYAHTYVGVHNLFRSWQRSFVDLI